VASSFGKNISCFVFLSFKQPRQRLFFTFDAF